MRLYIPIAQYTIIKTKGNSLLDGAAARGGREGSAIAMMFSFNGLCLLYKVRRGVGGTGDHYIYIYTFVCVVYSERKAPARED